VHSVASTIETLRHATPGQYFYQPTLIAIDGFYDRYALDRELIEFGECRPDLLMITAGDDGAKRVTVLDLKATDESKLSHKSRPDSCIITDRPKQESWRLLLQEPPGVPGTDVPPA
jgi:hypothetical protein